MEGISGLLNQVWSEFRKGGITDDIAIISQIADILLAIQGKPSPIAAGGNQKPEINRSFIKQRLQEALEQNQGDAGDLFDRYILFRLDKMLPGGRYPTPRHIVNHILNLAGIQSSHTLADFACGTGGFLVHSPMNPDASKLGIEISPEWANIAIANARLHGFEPSIAIGNSFREMIKRETQTFDRVVMNPPFGESVDAALSEKATGFPTGSNSETSFTALALNSLSTDGIAAVLVPSGVLQNNSRGEKELRQRMIDHYTLEAVVTYPRDAFQPYSSLTTHLLIIHNQLSRPDSLTWFFKATNDGFATGRGRNLTQEPQPLNDLFLIEEIYHSAAQFEAGEGEPVSAIQVEGEGFLIRPALNNRILSVRYYDSIDKINPLILISIHNGNTQSTWHLSPVDFSFSPVNQESETFLKGYYHKKSASDLPKPTLLFQNQTPDEDSLGDVLALDPYGKRLLGVAVFQETLRRRFYNLDPDQYIKAPAQEVTFASPEILLQSIRENQREINIRIESMIGSVLSARGEFSLPSPIALDEKSLIGAFNNEQLAIWEKILLFKEDVTLEDSSSVVAGRYFTDRDLIPEAHIDLTKSVLAALKIFEQMGLIVEVALKNPLTGDMMPFYRIVEKRDIWEQDAQAEIEGREE